MATQIQRYKVEMSDCVVLCERTYRFDDEGRLASIGDSAFGVLNDWDDAREREPKPVPTWVYAVGVLVVLAVVFVPPVLFALFGR